MVGFPYRGACEWDGAKGRMCSGSITEEEGESSRGLLGPGFTFVQDVESELEVYL